jgi:hypothetical protein
MRIDFKQRVKDVLGRDLSDGDLGWACAFALANSGVEPRLAPEKKFSRGVLAQRIVAGAAEWTVEEVAEMKAAVGELYSSALVAPIWQALEGS